MLAGLTLALLTAVGGPAAVKPGFAVEALVRGRTIANAPFGAIELRPLAKVAVRTPGVLLTTSYRARLFAGLGATTLTGVQHLGEVVADWDLARGRRLRFTQRVAYGYEDFGYIEFGGRIWSLEYRPPPVEKYLRSQTDITGQVQLSPRLGANLGVGFVVQGSERPEVPWQRGPYVSGTATYSLTLRDLLLTQVYASYVEVGEDGRTSGLVRVWETWRRELSRSTRLELGLGIGGLRRTDSANTAQGTALPVTQAALTYRGHLWRRELELKLEGRLAPYLNSYTGDGYERADVFASAALPLWERWRLRARVGAASSLGYQPAGCDAPTAACQERLLLGDLEAQLPLNQTLQLSLGTLGAWQEVATQGFVPSFQGSAYVSLVARTDAR